MHFPSPFLFLTASRKARHTSVRRTRYEEETYRAGVDRAVCTRTTGLADTMERARGAIDTPLNDETNAIFFSFGVAVV